VLLVFARALKGYDAGETAYNHYYVPGGPEQSWKDIATAFAKLLYANKKITEPEAKSVPLEDGGFLKE
jgi:hypothetical protein